jgi:hypothetical protein
MRGGSWKKVALLAALLLVLSVVVLFSPSAPKTKGTDTSLAVGTEDRLITEMIQQVEEKNIYNTASDLQNFTTRYVDTPGNQMAATYLHDRMENITGLTVEYQGGAFRNVVATLPGTDNAISTYCLIGAHYDSTSDKRTVNAPGATDDGGGVAIVVEMARVMSHYSFNHTIKFAFWNAEEGGIKGSDAFAREAKSSGQNIMAYLNLDSSCYDPDNRLVLDIMHNDQSKWFSDMMTRNNGIYDIGFNLTYNVHDCNSDHRSFWNNGYTAVMTHSEKHGPAHTQNDTVDKISTLYAKKNGQLGLTAVATVVEVVSGSQPGGSTE